MRRKAAILLFLIFTTGLLAEKLSLLSDVKKGFGLGRKENLKVLLAASVAVAGAFLIDEQVRDFLKRNQSDSLASLAELGNFFGDGEEMLPALAGIAGLALASKDKKLFVTSVEAAEAFAVSGIITTGIKLITMRKRPYKEEGKFSFDWGNKSFPSGHTTVSFAVFTVFARRYEIPQIYVIPALTAFARIYKDVHWLSDVVAGAAVGYVVGRSIVNLHKRTG